MLTCNSGGHYSAQSLRWIVRDILFSVLLRAFLELISIVIEMIEIEI